MALTRVVRGQRVDPGKRQLARELRRRMTSGERALWQALRRNSLGLHFRRQQIVAGFIVDFHCHAAGLAIELDGEIHDGRLEYDAERDLVLTRMGVRVLRIRNDAVRSDLASVIEQIAAAVT